MMLKDSVQAIDWVIARLEQQIQENKQLFQKQEVTAEETIRRNQKIISDTKTSAIEKLRALIVNVIESDDILQMHRQQASLLISSLFASSVRMLQEEVAFELNLLNAKILLQTPKSEQSEKYVEMEKELQRIKHVMDEEWKPLMNSLGHEIDRRNKFLNENR